MPDTVNAVQITAYGGPEVVLFGPVPAPVPAEDEVLIRLHAAGVNPVDWKTREGMRRSRETIDLPAVIGCDVSGTVVGKGSAVEGFEIGQEVFAMTGLRGAFKEVVAVKADQVAPKPTSIDHVHAAAVPLAALTAWQALDLAELAAGQRILIHAAAGGVGSFAVQLARVRGAEVVGTASARNADYVRSLGANQVIDYRTEAFETATRPVDVVFDLMGGETQARSWQVLKPGGILVTAVMPPAEGAPDGLRVVRVGVRPLGHQLREIAGLIDAGRVRIHVDRTLPLSDAGDALELVRQGHTRGKVVLVS